MSKQILFSIAIASMVASLPLTAGASDFDGSKPLICASIFSAECTANDQQCVTGAPWMINFPVFMQIDFKANTVSTTKQRENPRTSEISHVSKLTTGHTAILGIDENFAWSMLIAEETGTMTLTISGEDTGFIVFGACQPD